MTVELRTIKISAGCSNEYELFETNADDKIILENLKLLEELEENGEQIPFNPYFLIQEKGYTLNVLGNHDSINNIDDIVIDKEFDFYNL